MEQSLASEKSFSLKEDIFLKKLKESTAAAHQQLEDLPMSRAVTNPAVTVDDYSNYLQYMFPVVNDLEQNIYPLVSTLIPDIEKRRKSNLIASDLKVIGAEPSSQALPLTGSGQSISLPFAMGMMYVLEGSTLGGNFIGNNIQRTLGFDSSNGAGYFAGYGPQTGQMWKSFLESLSDFQKKENAEEEIIAGANFAFTSIYQYFKG